MKFVISRAGQQQGPYPMETLPEMIRSGSVLPTDLIYVEGSPTWIFLSDYLKGPTPVPAAKPPPLRSRQPPPIPAGQTGAPARGASAALPGGDSELERAVLEGGRFVFYQFCFSILVMTFKRPSSVFFLRGDEDGFHHAFSNSLVSLTAGWWGFPWGPIWTIATVIKNAQGGTDVTQAVLEEKLGPYRASQIMARRKPPSPCGKAMTCFRWGLVAAPVLLLLLVTLLPYALYRTESGNRGPASAQEVAFKAANRQIDTYRGTAAFGNSPEAIAVAASFSRIMKAIYEEYSKGDRKAETRVSDRQFEFMTYCELHQSQCAVIVHVPGLRNYSLEDKETLGKLTWKVAKGALKEQQANRPGMELAVGLRGMLIYDRVLVGKVETEAEISDQGLAETITGIGLEKRLRAFFTKPVKPVPLEPGEEPAPK
jgi:hypothetical protein